MSKYENRIIKTLMSDEAYNDLYELANSSPDKTYYERFSGDTNKTKIWIDKFGKLMSHMPPEPFMKEIITLSKMQKDEPSIKPKNGRGDLLLKLTNKGIPNDEAIKMAQFIYNKIDLTIIIDDDLVDNLINEYYNSLIAIIES